MRKKISKIALSAVLTTSLASISQAPSKANASFFNRFRVFLSLGKHNYNLQKTNEGTKLTSLSRNAWHRQARRGYRGFIDNNINNNNINNNNNLGNNPPTGIYKQIKN